MFDHVGAGYFEADRDLWITLACADIRSLSVELPKLDRVLVVPARPYPGPNAGAPIDELRFDPCGGPWRAWAHDRTCTIAAEPGFRQLSDQLGAVADYNSDEELAEPGWHMHLDLPSVPAAAEGRSIVFITIQGPNG